MATKPLHLAIIGAGPIGIEAALRANESGFKVSIFERNRIAENVQHWGHIQLFTPFEMNTSERGRQLLSQAGHQLPAGDAMLSGREFVNCYLRPLGEELKKQKSISVNENRNVVAISRGDFLKTEAIGSRRSEQKFRLLVESEKQEQIVWADFIFDCSGTYPNHHWLGTGGIACPGERSLAKKIEYKLPDLLNKEGEKYSGKQTLVVGNGYSAATTICELAKLSEQNLRTEIHWVTRNQTEDGPVRRVEEDSLAGRDELAKNANRLASDENSPVCWHRGVVVEHLHWRQETGKIVITLRSLEKPATESKQIEVQQIIAQVGYRPDRTLHEELQIHECYASSGPMKLAAFLLGEQASDCLAVSTCEAETLKNPEPGYYIVGSKSYGRNNQFLMQTGYEHLQQIFELPEMSSAR